MLLWQQQKEEKERAKAAAALLKAQEKEKEKEKDTASVPATTVKAVARKKTDVKAKAATEKSATQPLDLVCLFTSGVSLCLL